jgi:hypothetical protein
VTPEEAFNILIAHLTPGKPNAPALSPSPGTQIKS